MATKATATATGASADANAFGTILATIPYAPAQANAKGLIPTMIRSMGHILYCVGALADKEYKFSETEMQNELNHAAEHLDASVVLEANALSGTAKEHIIAYCTAVGHAKDSARFWSEADRIRLLKDLANRAAGLGAFLDREFIGIASDPGTSL